MAKVVSSLGLARKRKVETGFRDLEYRFRNDAEAMEMDKTRQC